MSPAPEGKGQKMLERRVADYISKRWLGKTYCVNFHVVGLPSASTIFSSFDGLAKTVPG